MRGLLLALGLGLILAGPSPGAPHRSTAYPNSLAIFAITEGPDQQLWLAANDGLYRFDGLHYAKVPGYPFVSARVLATASDGSVWVGSYEGLVRVRPSGSIETFLKGQDITSVASSNGKVFAKATTLYEVHLNGTVQKLPHELRRDLLVDSKGRIWSVCMRPDIACWFDPKSSDVLHQEPSVQGYQSALADPQGRIWGSNDQNAVLLGSGRSRTFERQPTLERRRQVPLLPGRNGQFWLIGETISGLNPAIEFRQRSQDRRFPPTAAYQDNRGDLWVAYLGFGLRRWSADPNWERWFPEDLDGEPPVEVIRDTKGGYVLSTHKHLYRWDETDRRWLPFTSGEHRFDGVLALEDGGFLASLRDRGVVRISANGRILETLRDPAPGMAYREIRRDAKGVIWITAKHALARVVEEKGSLALQTVKLPGDPLNGHQHVVDVETDATGRLWAGYQSGIAWLDDDGQWKQLKTDRPVTAVRSIAVGRDDIWVAYRHAGGFSRLHRSGDVWKVTMFDPASGYGPTDTNFLKRDSRGWIWRGSTEGVHISDGVHVEPEDWLHIPLSKGLASDETEIFGFNEDADGSVWIAGDEGLTRLHPNPAWFRSPGGAPILTGYEVDGRSFQFSAGTLLELPSGHTALRLRMSSLAGPPFRDAPILYRLLPAQDWKTIQDGSVEFRDLEDAEYRIEFSWNGFGAAPRAYRFRVGPEQRQYSWLWAALAIFGAVGLMIRYTDWLETPTFRVQKGLFMLRRRYSSNGSSATSSFDPMETGSLMDGRYALVRAVSRGGFSQVFEARDRSDGDRRVAVKILNMPDGDDRGVRHRFAQEVAALRSVHHPGVIPILNSWIEADGNPCIAMPFLEGCTLREALAGGSLEPARAARLIQQIGSAMETVHRHGIVHRDLKPENLMLTTGEDGNESAVIIDFGTAGLRAAEHSLAVTTMLAGSFHYMAPERLTGRYSPASDLYSFAVIIIEMLTGKRLSDFESVGSGQFVGDLKMGLLTVLPPSTAETMAGMLCQALELDPLKRPARVAPWSAGIAAACPQS